MIYLITSLIAISPAISLEYSSKDLKQTLATTCGGGKPCLFYFWSPHMPLSMRSRFAAERYARTRGVTLITLLDPLAKQPLAEAARRSLAWDPSTLRRAKAEEFIRRGVRVHYPSYVFARAGKLMGQTIPGARDEPELTRIGAKVFR